MQQTIMEHHKRVEHYWIQARNQISSEDLVRRLGLTTRSINIPIVRGHMHKKWSI